MKIMRFKVRMGRKLKFPTDMLRYDSAWPATEEDSVKLATAISSLDEWMELYVASGICEIELMTATAPTPARWASFGWAVR